MAIKSQKQVVHNKNTNSIGFLETREVDNGIPLPDAEQLAKLAAQDPRFPSFFMDEFSKEAESRRKSIRFINWSITILRVVKLIILMILAIVLFIILVPLVISISDPYTRTATGVIGFSAIAGIIYAIAKWVKP